MKLSLFPSLLLLAFLSSHSFAAEIKISGGAAPMNNIFQRIKESFEKKTGHVLTLSEQSPEQALQALDKGEIQAASAGLLWEDWLKLCAEKNIKIDTTKPYRSSSIGKDNIQIFINKSSPVAKLSFEQLAKIFSGKATNWKEFGGTDRPIKIVFSPNIAGTNKFFSKTVLGGADFKKDFVKAENAKDIAAKIGADADAIGFGPAGIDIEKFGAKVVVAPEISRPIFFVFLSTESYITELKNFISSPEGQALIKR